LLFVLTFFVLASARLMLLRLEKKAGIEVMNPIYRSRRRNDIIVRALCVGAPCSA